MFGGGGWKGGLITLWFFFFFSFVKYPTTGFLAIKSGKFSFHGVAI